MNKKISLGAAITFMAVVASITFCVTMLFSQDIFNRIISDATQREDMYDKIEEINKTIRNNYLFQIDEETLNDSMASGLINGLDDPYANYLTKEEYQQDQLQKNGELVGIGVQVKLDNSGYMVITSVYDDSPAMTAGLLKDDIIISIDDMDVAEIGYTESISSIQGEAGTKVNLIVRRDGEDSSYEIQRKNIEIPSIESRIIDNQLYIKITDFTNATPNQFESAVAEGIADGADGLIFDLRDNTGGTLSSVTDMLDYLLPKGVIATETDASGNESVIAESDANEIDMPMVTITNGNTASAAELFVIALKDYNKAQSVGTTTYGKGVMQNLFPLSDGSAVRITTAYFNPPVSQNFHGVGIAPDYEVVLTADQEKDFDNLDETTDPQLIKAIEVLNSRIDAPAESDDDNSTQDASADESASEESDDSQDTTGNIPNHLESVYRSKENTYYIV